MQVSNQVMIAIQQYNKLTLNKKPWHFNFTTICKKGNKQQNTELKQNQLG